MATSSRGMATAAAAAFVAFGSLEPAAGQSKIIEMPRKTQAKAQCTKYPPRLDGEFTQVLNYEVGGLKETHTTKGRITWLQEVDELPPLPSRAGASDGMVGSKAWTDFHAKARCPVQSYRVSGGELAVETVAYMDSSLATCDGKGTANYDAAAVLEGYSALYIADGAYLLTMGSPDVRMGVDNVSGECRDKLSGKKFAYEPVARQINPNMIWILDRRGPVTRGVHGEISPAISAPSRKKLTARWDFANTARNQR